MPREDFIFIEDAHPVAAHAVAACPPGACPPAAAPFLLSAAGAGAAAAATGLAPRGPPRDLLDAQGGCPINMCLLPPLTNPRPDPHMQYEYAITSSSIARAFFEQVRARRRAESARPLLQRHGK